MSRQWLFKTEPSEYSYDDLERETKAVWDGVTNSLALKHLRQVRMGDEILIYHSGDVKAIIGLAQAVSDPYPNPREDDDKLIVINLKPKRRLVRPITLSEIKVIEEFKEFDLLRLPRLSVIPIPDNYWDRLQDLMTF
jgi:predicted RNA-binding protein with PUA-like domain